MLDDFLFVAGGPRIEAFDDQAIVTFDPGGLFNAHKGSRSLHHIVGNRKTEPGQNGRSEVEDRYRPRFLSASDSVPSGKKNAIKEVVNGLELPEHLLMAPMAIILKESESVKPVLVIEVLLKFGIKENFVILITQLA